MIGFDDYRRLIIVEYYSVKTDLLCAAANLLLLGNLPDWLLLMELGEINVKRPSMCNSLCIQHKSERVTVLAE